MKINDFENREEKIGFYLYADKCKGNEKFNNIEDNINKNSINIYSLKFLPILTLLLTLLLFLPSIAFAIPNSLTLQGKLTNLAGTSQQGTFNFTFKIYDNATAGNELWSVINQSVATDANGVYDVILSGINLSFADHYYLGIAVQGENESVPRINLTSAPYSFRANTSEALNPNASYFVTNLSISGHATIGNGTSTIEISTQLFNFSSTTGNLNINGTVTAKSFAGDGSLLTGVFQVFNSSGTNVYLNDSTANLGLGMSNPSDRLVVIGNVRISGSLNASSINTTGGAYFAINTGRVGIGTTSPTEILTVIGNANISGYLNISGDLIVNKQFNVSASTGNVNVAGTLDANNLKIQGSSLGDRFTNYSLVNFTSNLNSVNASISLWNVSGSNIYPREISGKVGVNTTSPAQTLTVQGTLNVTGNSTGVGDLFVTSLGRIGIGTSNPTKRLSINGTLDAITFDPSASPNPVINTTGNNLTISSASGSVIIRLG